MPEICQDHLISSVNSYNCCQFFVFRITNKSSRYLSIILVFYKWIGYKVFLKVTKRVAYTGAIFVLIAPQLRHL